MTLYQWIVYYYTKVISNKKLSAICGKPVDEVHHIQEQQKANERGFIGHINKNHKFNLIPLCAKHHKLVHDGRITINGFVTTSKGLELHYSAVEEK